MSKIDKNAEIRAKRLEIFKNAEALASKHSNADTEEIYFDRDYDFRVLMVLIHSRPSCPLDFVMIKGHPVNVNIEIKFSPNFQKGKIKVCQLSRSYAQVPSLVIEHQKDIQYRVVETISFDDLEGLYALLDALLGKYFSAVYDQSDLDDKTLELYRKECEWADSQEAQKQADFTEKKKQEKADEEAQERAEFEQDYKLAKAEYLAKHLSFSASASESFEFSFSKQADAELQVSQPQKRKLLERFLSKKGLLLTVNGMLEGCWLPPNLLGLDTVLLPIEKGLEFEITDTHMKVEIKFYDMPFLCFIPLKAIYEISNLVHTSQVDIFKNMLADMGSFADDVADAQNEIQKLSSYEFTEDLPQSIIDDRKAISDFVADLFKKSNSAKSENEISLRAGKSALEKAKKK